MIFLGVRLVSSGYGWRVQTQCMVREEVLGIEMNS